MTAKPIPNQVIDQCSSTNDLARQLGEAGAPHGTWISARMQTSGRGRLGRQWQSEAGNLFLSIVLRVEPRTVWTWIPLASALAVAGYLRELDPALPIRVKWPNDLWLAGAKLGGILGEAVGNRTSSFLILGIGLNCAAAPENLDQPTAKLGWDVDELRPGIISAIISAVDELASSGPGPSKERYAELAALSPGTAIEWGESSSGIVQGLGDSGELVVRIQGRAESDRLEKLFAEDVKVRVLPSRQIYRL